MKNDCYGMKFAVNLNKVRIYNYVYTKNYF